MFFSRQLSSRTILAVTFWSRNRELHVSRNAVSLRCRCTRLPRLGRFADQIRPQWWGRDEPIWTSRWNWTKSTRPTLPSCHHVFQRQSMQAIVRGAWSCEACRRRKVKCDSKDPCAHCVRRGEACAWPDNTLPKPAPPRQEVRVQSHEDLQTRVERIEAVLEQSGLLVTPVAIHNSPEAGDVRQRRVAISDLADAGREERLQAEVHRHDNFDHHIIGESPTQLRDDQHDVRQINGTPRTVTSSLAALRARQFITRVLPTQRECDDLLRSYLHNVEWIHHPLHVPRFRAEYDTFWMERGQNTCDTPNLQWQALLMIVLCLGSHFDEHQQSIAREEELYAASHELLTLSNHLANHSLTVIQTLILMGLWLNNRGQSNTHHVQLALAIKMAMNLGFSKLDATMRSDYSDDTFFALHNRQPSDALPTEDEEMKRRIWWSLVCQDYYTASSCNFTYTVHPRQCRTELFLNIDDHHLPAEGTHIPSMTVPNLQALATTSSYQLLKIPFARIAKSQTDLYNEEQLTFDAVLKLESLLWATYNALPQFWKWQPNHTSRTSMPASRHVVPEHLEWQRLFLGFTVHNRVLRLHRPFMSHGYSNPEMIHSRQATIESALACLSLAEEGRDINFPGLRWWVVLIHIFTSGVALCIDYHFLVRYQRQAVAGTDFSQLKRSRREHISRATRLLRPASNSSVAAARAIAVIASLVEQAEGAREDGPDSRKNPPTKRKRRPENSVAAISPSYELLEQSRPSTNTSPPGSSLFVEETNSDHPPEDDWLTALDAHDWNGPDWEQLLASFPANDYSLDEGMSADLYETINSFATGFATE